jgi:putative flippase GtrA
MDHDPGREKGRDAFLRFGASGVVFTILGPAMFWLAYPLGPFLALAIAELGVQSVRFVTFRSLVFPASKGYRVSLPRYVVSALPLTFTGFASVALLRHHLDRTALTLVGALTSLVVGFLWSRFVYSQPVQQPSSIKPGGGRWRRG